MKKVLLFSLSLLISAVVLAQPKGKPSKAKAYLAKDDLENAQAEIDLAVTTDKYKEDQAAWITRGKVYQAMALKGDDAALTTAMDSFNKAKELDPESSAAKLLDIQELSQFHGGFFNIASEAYNNEDYPTSVANFQKALRVLPDDSTTMYYGALAAYQADMYDVTLEMYEMMIERDYADKEVYTNAIYMAREEVKDNDRAMTIIKKAQEDFPDHNQYKYDEINIYLTTGQEEEATRQLEEAVKKEPDNASLHLQLGLFKDNAAYNLMVDKNWDEARPKYEEAKGHYTKAIEIEPENFVANYNLGVVFVNMAKEHYDIVREMDIATYNKSGKDIMAKGNEIIKGAIPYIEKATDINPDDVDAWKALQQIYTQLKMNDKAQEAFNKVEALEGGE